MNASKKKKRCSNCLIATVRLFVDGLEHTDGDGREPHVKSSERYVNKQNNHDDAIGAGQVDAAAERRTMAALVRGSVAKGGFKNVDVPNRRIIVVNNSAIIIVIRFTTCC